MRILLTNDDGIHSEGLEALERIARQLSDDVWVVAPETDQSGLSHSLTLSMPLRLRKIDDRHYAVRGTPTDCVIMAISHLMDEKPDLLLSGVNSGVNIADDVTYSGTVAGAIEGTLVGVRSIALSQAYGYAEGARVVSYAAAEARGAELIGRLLDYDLPPSTLLNVNFPDCDPSRIEGVEVVRQGRIEYNVGVEERADGRGFPYFWVNFGRTSDPDQAHTDIQAIRNNRISVTPLKLDMTDHDQLADLERALAGK